MLVRQTYTEVAAILAIIVGTAAAAGSSVSSPVEVLEGRRQPLLSDGHILGGVKDSITAYMRGRDAPSVYDTSASLDLGWNNAELFSYGRVTVSCVTCYVKGNAQATLTISRDMNITTAIETVAEGFVEDIENITSIAFDTFKNWTETLADINFDQVENMISGDESIFDAFAFPVLPIDFDLGLEAIPETKVNMVFDAFELYLELDVSVDASIEFTVPLYPTSGPMQPAGFQIGDQTVGVVISLDLILALDASVNISTGVHVQFDDGLTLELELFGSDVSTVNLYVTNLYLRVLRCNCTFESLDVDSENRSPGMFEFLPVQVSTSGFTLDATLRLGVTTGLELASDSSTLKVAQDLLQTIDLEIGAGASATAYADVAHFSTNITPSDTSIVLKSRDDTSYSDECHLPVIETYEFGLGAQAGAYVEFDNHTWGPTPETSIQIFYTTLYSACATSASATASDNSSVATSTVVEAKRTEPARLAARDDALLTLSSTVSTYTVTNVVCQSTGLVNCPASLQSTAQTTKTSTISAFVTAGAELTLPATTDTSVSTKPFGTGVKSIQASSGSPVPYVPPAASTSTASGIDGAINDAKDSYNGLSDSKKKLTIGLSVAFGGALLIGFVALAICCVRRRKNNNGADFNVSSLWKGKTSGVEYTQPFLASTPASSQQLKWNSASNFGAPEIHEREVYDESTAYVSPQQAGQAAP
ncbi:unnamed protein product [Discula destructiva]